LSAEPVTKPLVSGCMAMSQMQAVWAGVEVRRDPDSKSSSSNAPFWGIKQNIKQGVKIFFNAFIMLTV